MESPAWLAVADVARFDPAKAGSRAPSAREALGEFEAYFVGELLRIAGRANTGGGLLDGGHGGRMYRELFLEEVGRLAVARGGLGLADSLAPGMARGGPDEAARRGGR